MKKRERKNNNKFKNIYLIIYYQHYILSYH